MIFSIRGSCSLHLKGSRRCSWWPLLEGTPGCPSWPRSRACPWQRPWSFRRTRRRSRSSSRSTPMQSGPPAPHFPHKTSPTRLHSCRASVDLAEADDGVVRLVLLLDVDEAADAADAEDGNQCQDDAADPDAVVVLGEHEDKPWCCQHLICLNFLTQGHRRWRCRRWRRTAHQSWRNFDASQRSSAEGTSPRTPPGRSPRRVRRSWMLSWSARRRWTHRHLGPLPRWRTGR